MKILQKLVFLSILNLLYVACQDQAGMKIAVKQEVIEGFQKKFIPLLAEKIGNLNIPGAIIPVDAKIGTLYITLDNIHFHIRNVIAENINITFQEPDKILVLARDIAADGHLDVSFRMSFFLSETDSIDLIIKRLATQAEVTLGTQESSKIKGKLMPSASITNMNIDIDFDFDVQGKAIALIADLVKGLVKNFINDAIQTQLKQVIIEETKKVIADSIDQLPIYVPLSDNGLALDYSLLSAPKVSNGYLIVNSHGAIVNLNKPETLNPPFPYSNIPDYDPEGKLIQLFLSEYSINSAIYSLYVSDILNIMVPAEIVPDFSPVQLNTTSMGSFITGLTELYGDYKLMDVEAKVVDEPKVWFNQNLVHISVETEITLFVRLDDGTQDEALSFTTIVSAYGDAHLQAEGQISALIRGLSIDDSVLIDSKVKITNIHDIEVVFNLAAKIALPIVNNNYLKNITVKLPSIEGISFGNSTVFIKDENVELNVNPRFSKTFFKDYWTRRCSLKSKKQEKKSQPFLTELE